MLNFDTNYRQASMLYLESPAGSGSAAGYSTCINGAKPVPCQWNDTSQAEAYAHTLTAFYKVCTYETNKQTRVAASTSTTGQAASGTLSHRFGARVTLVLCWRAHPFYSIT